MGNCLGVFSRKGSYNPRRVEQEDLARNSGFQHNVYRRDNNSRAERASFGSKTVIQSWPTEASGAVISPQNVAGAKEYKDINDLIKDLVKFDEMDSPPEYPEVDLTEQQEAKITDYLSTITRNDVSFCYQYFPPCLPPGPDGICAKQIECYLDKREPEDFFMVIRYLRFRQYQKLIRAFCKLNDFLKLGLSPDFIKSVTLDIFSKWETTYGQFITKKTRALACLDAILSSIPYFKFPAGTSIAWSLFQVMHPPEETSGVMRIHDKNFIQSTRDREQNATHGKFPIEVTSLESFRKGTFKTFDRRRDRFISQISLDEDKLTQFDGGIIIKMYHFDMDESTMAQTIPKRGIGLCYYNLFRNYKGDQLEAALDSKAPRGSSKQDVIHIHRTTGPAIDHHRADSGQKPSLPSEGSLDEESTNEVIQRFCESVMHDDDLLAEGEEATEHRLSISGQREEFSEIKERAEKQKRWKRRFDSTKKGDQHEEATG